MTSQSHLFKVVQNFRKSNRLRNGNGLRRVSTSSTWNANNLAGNQIDTQHIPMRRLHGQPGNEPEPLITNNQNKLEQLAITHSLNSIKRFSHRLAQLDPLKLNQDDVDSLDKLISEESQWIIKELRLKQDLVETKGLLNTGEQVMPISEMIDTIFKFYVDQQCGLEYAHLSNQVEMDWLTSEWEHLNATFSLSREQEIDIAKLLLKCEQFDHFLAAKYPTTKRYGCEGAESMLIVFDELLKLAQTTDQSKATRVNDVLIAMPHRGRLNLLACLLGMNPAIIFNKCQGEPELNLSEAWMASGDVLSHLSLNSRFVYGVDRHHLGLYRESPEPINLSLLPNPSHLEVGSAMVMGAARGRAHNLRYGYSSSPKFNVKPQQSHPVIKQHEDSPGIGDPNSTFSIDAGYSQYLNNVLSIQVHGDASLAGQGIIQESLQMSNLQQFTVNGSIHLVVNNQIGYTTPSSMGRSSRHCTDVFKMTDVPIIHINGENITSVLKATRLAYNYRRKFGKDIALDLICFRRHGHNEMDEPSFTQPVMYHNIRNRKSIPETYCDAINLGDELKGQIVTNYKTILQEIYSNQKDQNNPQKHKPNNDDYRNFSLPTEYHRDHLISWKTGCDENLLRQVGLASVKYPSEGGDSSGPMKVHPTLERSLISERRSKFEKQLNPKVDWATAEILAIGSLLRQNHSVRIAGQDVARGTFSTRHAVLFDQQSERPYVPLNWMGQDSPGEGQASGKNPTDLLFSRMDEANLTQDAKLEVANTILSEEAALAYEFGYSIETCELSIWEAQFGDFFNTAQSIIDTLISSGESKWLRQSALTLLLPHGLDGAGPEHSSARLERFLQLSKSQLDQVDTDASVNWSVCFPTLPSQYFHLLRRQVLRPFRKPLVVMSPKSIFRHPQCESALSDFGLNQTFQPVLDDPAMSTESQRNKVTCVVLCSGKIYFKLDEIRKAANGELSNVALVRLEELCPFPVQAIQRTLQQYTQVDNAGNQNKLIWFQEEHQNQGAYQFVRERLASLLNIQQIHYMGRDVSELPAVGSSSLDKRESSKLIEQFKSLSRNKF